MEVFDTGWIHTAEGTNSTCDVSCKNENITCGSHTDFFFLFSLFILQCESSQCSENIFQLFNKNIKEGTPFTGGETSVLH